MKLAKRAAVAAVSAVLLSVIATAPVRAAALLTATVFVGNGYDPVNGSTVTVYPPGSKGNVTPSSILTGSNTLLDYPFGLAYSTYTGSIGHTAPFLYVVNYGGASISYFSQFRYSNSGNHHPDGTISGPLTGITDALGVAVDNINGNVYVANSEGGTNFFGSITVYTNAQIAAIPYEGIANIAPAATIVGPATGLNWPQGVAVDPDTGNLYVANLEGPQGTDGSGSVTEFTAAQIAAIIGGGSGNVAPAKTIVGYLTGLSQPSGIALDTKSNIYVANNGGDDNGCGPYTTGCVTSYTQAAIAATVPDPEPSGGVGYDVIPQATILGPATLLSDIDGIAVDANGFIYVANFGETGSVTVYFPGSNGNVAPTADITGSNTDLYGPRGLAVDPPPARTRVERKRP